MIIDEQMKEKAAICIQSCVRGYFQRRYSYHLTKKYLTRKKVAIIIQKYYRGFLFRKALNLYKQRLNTQMLCFLQHIELLNNDFFMKIVRTNYCVPLKSVDTKTNYHINAKQLNKLLQHVFPPPPPLPFPSTIGVFPPPLSHTVSLNSMKIQMNAPSVPSASAALSPSRHRLISTSHSNRSPSPTPSISKFAQVRDMFVRAEAKPSVTNHHPIPMKTHVSINPTTLHTSPSNEQDHSLKATSVLNAVQEYQRQHINIYQPHFKRLTQSGSGAMNNAYRLPNFGGIRSRGNTPFGLNNNKLQNKQTQPSYVISSPKQQSKSSTQVI